MEKDFYKHIFRDRVNKNSYVPVLSDDNKLVLFTVIPSTKSNKLLINATEKDTYMYELSSFFEAGNLIEKNKDQEFLLEIPISISTLLNGLFIKSIQQAQLPLYILNRIVLSVKYHGTFEEKQLSISKMMQQFQDEGFKTIVQSNEEGLNYGLFSMNTDFIKFDLKNCPLSLRNNLIKFLIKESNPFKTIILGINEEKDYIQALSLGVKFFQGDYIGKEKPSLISGVYNII